MLKPAVVTLLSVGGGIVLKCSRCDKKVDEGVFQLNLVLSGHLGTVWVV